MFPESLTNLINQLKALPGISKRQAEKIALALVTTKQEVGEELMHGIEKALRNIKPCVTCFHLSESKECPICHDLTRENKLVIVESSLDVFKLEALDHLRPHYHVLGNLINVARKINFKSLNIQNLQNRAKSYQEIIIALSPTLEGMVTANYLKNLFPHQKVTQLAQGIPLGAAMEYVDKLTLTSALQNRKDVK